VLRLGAGDIFVTPKGSNGTWRVQETLAKFFAIYTGGAIGDTTMDFIMRELAQAKRYTKAGFDAFWNAVAG